MHYFKIKMAGHQFVLTAESGDKAAAVLAALYPGTPYTAQEAILPPAPIASGVPFDGRKS